MPQDMRVREFVRDARSLSVLLEKPTELHPRHRAALLRREQHFRPVFDALFQPCPQRNEFVQCWLAFVASGFGHPRQSPCSLNRDRAVRDVDIRELERADFAAPQRMRNVRRNKHESGLSSRVPSRTARTYVVRFN